jgi:hypothetical protein
MSKKNIIMALVAISFIGGGDTKGLGLGKAVASWNQNRSNTNGASRVGSSGSSPRATVSKLTSKAASSGSSSRATVSNIVTKARSSAVSRSTSSRASPSAPPTLRSLYNRLSTLLNLQNTLNSSLGGVSSQVTNFGSDIAGLKSVVDATKSVLDTTSTNAAAAANSSALAVTNTDTIIANQGASKTQAATDTADIKADIAATKIVVDATKSVLDTTNTNAALAANSSALAVTNTDTIIANQGASKTQAATDTADIKADIAGISSSGGSGGNDNKYVSKLTGFTKPEIITYMINGKSPNIEVPEYYYDLLTLYDNGLISYSDSGIPTVPSAVSSYLNARLLKIDNPTVNTEIFAGSKTVPVSIVLRSLDNLVAKGGWSFS